VTDDLPGGSEELGLFLLKGLRFEIQGCGQRGSASNIAIGIHLKVRHGRSGEGYSTAETPSTLRKSEENREPEGQRTAPIKSFTIRRSFLDFSRHARRLGGDHGGGRKKNSGALSRNGGCGAWRRFEG
jgi:hypothetical protein